MNRSTQIRAALLAAAFLTLTGCGRMVEETEIITEPTAETMTAPPETVPTTAEETTLPEITTEPTTAPPATTTVITVPVTETQSETAGLTTEATVWETVTSESAVSDDEIRISVENGDLSLVTPEFKALLDEYEAFYDEYIAFMQKYASGDDLMGMLTEYSDILVRLDDWTQRIAAIDEATLTPADHAYFMLVTARIENKLMAAAELY